MRQVICQTITTHSFPMIPLVARLSISRSLLFPLLGKHLDEVAVVQRTSAGNIAIPFSFSNSICIPALVGLCINTTYGWL